MDPEFNFRQVDQNTDNGDLGNFLRGTVFDCYPGSGMVTDAGLRKKAIFRVAMMTEVRDAGIS